MANAIQIVARLNTWARTMWPYVSATLSGSRGRHIKSLRKRTRIREQAGIDEFYSREINGVRQWLRIRGTDTRNPLLVYLHGGPGGSSLPIYSLGLHGWETHFTVVQWDQRGSGKSYYPDIDPKSMTLNQLIADASLVIDHVREKLGKDKICLLGHSWGSFLAVHLLLRDSRSVGAYVGTGQVVDMLDAEKQGYQFALERAQQECNERGISELRALAPYPTGTSRDHAKRRIARRWARHYGWAGSDEAAINRNALMSTPEYSLLDIYRYFQGSLFSLRLTTQMIDPVLQPVLQSTSFDVPIFLLSGSKDTFTPTSLVETYFQRLSAPIKEHIIFQESGHWPMLTEYEGYLGVLSRKVRPHVVW